MIRINPKYNAVNVFPPNANSYNNSSLPIGEGEIWPKFTKTLWHCLRYFFNPKQIMFIVSHYFFPKSGLDMGKIDYHVFGTSREQRIATFYFSKCAELETSSTKVVSMSNLAWPLVHTDFQTSGYVFKSCTEILYWIIWPWLRTT